MNRTTLTAILTVAVGAAAFIAADILRPEERAVTFETEPADIGPLEALNGARFPRANGVAVITEPLAHVRLPFQRTLLGKRLTIRPRFHLDEGDVLEVGVKKTAFWLDYDRQPLQHRTLDFLLVRDDVTWSALRTGDHVVYLNPRFDNPWSSVTAFEERPPTDGVIGLYGNARLVCSSGQQATGNRQQVCETRPFRVTDDPDAFRAIYAWYPLPDQTDPEWTVNAQTFNLSRAYQNEDGSLDVMFFVQRKDDGPTRVLLDEIRFSVEPGVPKARDLAALARRNLLRLFRRPAPSAT